MNEQKIIEVKSGIRPFVVGFMFGVFCMFVLTSTRNTPGDISDIRQQQQQISNEINGVGVRVEQAKESIAGANQRIDEVQGKLGNIAEGISNSQREIDNLSKLARECKEIAERNGAIFEKYREKNR